MLVKCWDLNEKRPKEESYKAPNGKYYTCKEAYDKMRHEKEFRDKCIDRYREWVGRKDVGPSIWTKKMKECENYGTEVIYAAMLLSEDSVKYASQNKTFRNEYQAASYYWAIVNGNMLTARKQVTAKNQREKEAKEQEKYREYEEVQVQPNHRNNTVDISKFLD